MEPDETMSPDVFGSPDADLAEQRWSEAFAMLLVEKVKAGDGGAGYRQITDVDRAGVGVAPTAVAGDVEACVASLPVRLTVPCGAIERVTLRRP
jgi:hypothetical protein